MANFDEAWDSVGTNAPNSFDAAWDLVPSSAPSLRDATQQVAKDLGTGIFTSLPAMGGLIQDSGNYLMRKAASTVGFDVPEQPFFQATPKYVGEAKNAFDYLSGHPEDLVQGPVEDFSRAALSTVALPGAPIKNALMGIGAEAGHKIAPESPIAPLLGALATHSATSLLTTGAKAAVKSANAFERASVGAGTKDYLKSLKKQGLLESENPGELTTKLGSAINEIGSTEGWGVIRTPEKLVNRNSAALADTGKKIGTLLDQVDATGVSPTINFLEEGSATQNLISKSTAEKSQVAKAVEEFLSDFTDPKYGWNGSTADLNSWKSSIGQRAWSGSSQGTLQPATLRKVQKALYADMDKAVQEAAVNSGVAAPEELSNLFNKYSIHKEVQPILLESVAKGESSTGASVLRNLLKTSGGTLSTPTMIGAAVGGTAGGPVGLILGAGLGALGSPTGAGVASNLLKAGGKVADKTSALIKSGIPANLATKAIPLTAQVLGKSTKPASPIDEVFNQLSGDKIMSPDTKPDTLIGLPKDDVLNAIKHIESGDRKDANDLVSKAGALGAYQFMPATAKALGIDPHDPVQARDGAIRLLEENQKRFEKAGYTDPLLSIAAYNWNPNSVQKTLEKYGATSWDEIAYYAPEETQKYIKKFLNELA